MCCYAEVGEGGWVEGGVEDVEGFWGWVGGRWGGGEGFEDSEGGRRGCEGGEGGAVGCKRCAEHWVCRGRCHCWEKKMVKIGDQRD